ncbi:MAG: hypothetical protein KDC83_14130 [Flavobacteriales bacterium]|nr:hypothetical protein [Flavobacteriales bacterium]
MSKSFGSIKQYFTPTTIQKTPKGTATALRGTLDAGDFKVYIFPLLFFKRLSNVFDGEYEKPWLI